MALQLQVLTMNFKNKSALCGVSTRCKALNGFSLMTVHPPTSPLSFLPFSPPQCHKSEHVKALSITLNSKNRGLL